jgi:hypothetical protein
MIRVLGDRVLVLLPEKPHVQEAATGYTYQPGQTTDAGLIVAKPSDTYNVEIATRGIVVQLGEKETRVELEDVRSELHTYFVELSKRFPVMAPDGSFEVPTRDVRDDLDRLLTKMLPAPFDVNVGDVVVFAPGAGDLLPFDGRDYLLLYESDLLGVLEPKAEAA